MDTNVSGLVKHSLRERHSMSVIIESLETDPAMGRDNYPSSSLNIFGVASHRLSFLWIIQKVDSVR